MRRAILVVAFGLLAPLRAGAQLQQTPLVASGDVAHSPLRDLSAAEWRAALRDTASAITTYAGDGTPRADSARRVAVFAAWNLEGGDHALGLRAYRVAFWLGVADPRFYRDAIEISKLFGRPEDRLLVYREATRRWPDDPWGWRGLASELGARGRSREATAARAQAAKHAGSPRP